MPVEHASVIPVPTFAELATTPGTKPFAFCIENGFLYFWNPNTSAWVAFPNLLAVIQEITNACEGLVASVNGQTGAVVLDKSHIGLPNADNTADSAKPVSTAQDAADDAVQAFAVQRGNHTGTQTASTISDFGAAAVTAVPLVSTNPFGYATGAGGTVTQATSKSTAVTLNKLCGQITMHGAALAAGAIVSFTLNNTQIGANDLIILNHVATATFGPYLLNARAAAGSAVIDVRNTSAGSLSNAIQIRFLVIKGVVS